MSPEESKFSVSPDSQMIWRYMDFSKYVAMLSTGTLHFSRADKFIDTFESAIPKRDIASAYAYYKAQIQGPVVVLKGITQFEKSIIRPYLQHFFNLSDEQVHAITEEELPRYMMRVANRFTFINCWHANDDESAGMWDIYANHYEGVTVQSTIGRLKESIDTGNKLFVGDVNYIDYNTDSWGDFNPLYPVFHKRKNFAHEREVRAVIANPSNIEISDTGVNIPVDITTLVNKVHIAPKADAWFKEVVQSVSQKYGLDIEPVKSNLYDEPVF